MGQVAGKPGQSTHLAAGQLVQPVAPHPTWTACAISGPTNGGGTPPSLALGFFMGFSMALGFFMGFSMALAFFMATFMDGMATHRRLGFAMGQLGCLEQWLQLQNT